MQKSFEVAKKKYDYKRRLYHLHNYEKQKQFNREYKEKKDKNDNNDKNDDELYYFRNYVLVKQKFHNLN